MNCDKAIKIKDNKVFRRILLISNIEVRIVVFMLFVLLLTEIFLKNLTNFKKMLRSIKQIWKATNFLT